MVRENREEDVGIDTLHFRIGRQIDDVVREIRNRIVLMKLLQNRHAIGGLHMPALRAFQLRAFVPRVHNQQNREGKQHREPTTMQELRHGSEEEHELDRKEQHGEYDRSDTTPECQM